MCVLSAFYYLHLTKEWCWEQRFYIVQQFPITGTLERFFLCVETWVFLDVNQLFALFFAIICQRKFSQCSTGRAKTYTCHKIELLILFDSTTNDKKFYNLTNLRSLHIHYVKKSLISKDNYLFSLMIHIFCFFDLFLGRFLTPCVFVQSKINLSYLKTFV